MRIYDERLQNKFEEKGYKVVAIRRFGDSVYVEITDRRKLEEASEFGRTLGVTVSVRA